MYLYETAWRYFQFGYASAISVVLAAIMIVVTIVLFYVMRRRTEYWAAGVYAMSIKIKTALSHKKSLRTLGLWLIFLPLVFIVVVPLLYMVSTSFTRKANQLKIPITT